MYFGLAHYHYKYNYTYIVKQVLNAMVLYLQHFKNFIWKRTILKFCNTRINVYLKKYTQFEY